MGKNKTRPELKEDLKAAKEEAKVARQEKRDFEKTNKLEKDTDHSSNEKHGKKWSKLNDMVVKKESAVEKAQAAYDGAKEEKKPRTVKYEYPLSEATGKEMTADEKKKYRTKMRNAKKKAEKAETEGTKEGKEGKKSKKKNGKKEEAKESKKSKKKAPEVEDEEEMEEEEGD